MKRKLIIIAGALLVICAISFGLYVNDYYHAEDSISEYVNGTDNVKVNIIDNGLFLDGPGNETALIFYPGAKVEYTAYLPLLSEISSGGIDCFLIEMPFNIAIFNANAADGIISNYEYENYYMSGHSLGGVMAAQYGAKSNETDGLILFESYSNDEITKPVLSIYGSEDEVLNIEKYQKARHLMTNLTEIIIPGGNHAQVGNYGIQKDDGTAKISSQKQQKLSADATLSFINNITH